MGLNRLALGLASLTFAAGIGLGFAVKEVKIKELGSTLKQKEKDYLNLEDVLKTTNDERQKLEDQLDERTKELEDERERSRILQEGFDRLREEKVNLQKQLQEPKTVTVSRGGSRGTNMTVTATAYIALCDTGCIGITATGIDVRKSITYNGRGIVAVDPKVIPLGSIVVIDGKEYLAADTGGLIKGNRIDILMRTTKEAFQFGKQKMNITVYPKG